MKNQLLALTFILYLINGIAYAEEKHEHMYFGVGLAFVDSELKIDGVGSLNINNSLLGLNLGYQLHENFAIEARGAGNISDDEILGTSIAIDNHFSILGKGILPVHKSFRPYALLGFGKSKLSVGGVSDSDNDIIYGVGAAISNGNRVQLELEWVRMYDEKESVQIDNINYNTSLTADSVNLNLIYHFPPL